MLRIFNIKSFINWEALEVRKDIFVHCVAPRFSKDLQVQVPEAYLGPFLFKVFSVGDNQHQNGGP